MLSDIHGNQEALLAVLRDLDRLKADKIVSLGDNIGYGPEPDDVIRTLETLAVPSVMGNHELGIVDPASRTWFNKSALQSLKITHRLLSDRSLEAIFAMPATLDAGGGLLVHGCPPNSITRYIFEVSTQEMVELLEQLEQETCFVGHSHVLSLYCHDGAQVQEQPLREGVTELMRCRSSIVNAGSVGQPRDGDNRAKYLIWEPAERCVEVRCVPYDIAKTAARIIERGLPRFNADRLW
ncbi:MAG: metallophosphoesterase [Syntrophobacteraceae bacterium]